MRASRPPHARLTWVSCRSRALLQRSSGAAGQARHHPAGAPGRRGVLAHVKRQGVDDEAIGVRTTPGGADGHRGTRRPRPGTGHRPPGPPVPTHRPTRTSAGPDGAPRPPRSTGPRHTPPSPPPSPPPEPPGPQPGSTVRGHGPHRVRSSGRSKDADRAGNGIGMGRVQGREDRNHRCRAGSSGHGQDRVPQRDAPTAAGGVRVGAGALLRVLVRAAGRSGDLGAAAAAAGGALRPAPGVRGGADRRGFRAGVGDLPGGGGRRGVPCPGTRLRTGESAGRFVELPGTRR